ncbi:hypothetical protein L1049_019510 [Liquidambar formosana]|uniref:Uncharacterized protein n=1 Tax=Liquidambar formosana TaxID=63359 RepID=A0AAP0X6J8_LIQFO
MSASRLLSNVYYKSSPISFFFFSNSNHHRHLASSQYRSIFTTTHLENSWMDKIKGVFTGKKTTPEPSQVTAESFTLLRFADELKNARRAGNLKQFIVGRSSEATFADAFEKQEAIIRYLGGFDATGENLQISQKQEAAKRCNCTIAEVENALAKFTWAKEAQKKIQKLKEEGKPMPKSLAEVLFLAAKMWFYFLGCKNDYLCVMESRDHLVPCFSYFLIYSTRKYVSAFLSLLRI